MSQLSEVLNAVLLPQVSAVPVGLSSSSGCIIQALVRAPDLDPGEIIPGQVRIQTREPAVVPISEYSLILRFKERMRVKILKSTASTEELQGPNVAKGDRRPRAAQLAEWNMQTVLNKRSLPTRGFESNDLPMVNQKIDDPALWDIAEEERIAFETRYKLFNGPPQSEIRAIHDFSLLVPTTNYPPSSIDSAPFPFIRNMETATRDNEHIYLYTVEVKFLDGTIVEVPAGRTSFKAVGPNYQDPKKEEVMTFSANFTEGRRSGLAQSWTPLNISFDVDVTFPYGRRLVQGSTLDLTISVHDEPRVIPDPAQANFNIVLGHPLIDLLTTTTYRRMETLLPGINVPAHISVSHPILLQLSPTSNDSEHSSWRHDRPCSEHRFRKPHWNKTTSLSYEIHKMAFPSFEMHYQSIEAKIEITLNIQTVPTQDPLLAREDYAWIPALPVPRFETTGVFQSFKIKIPVTLDPRARKPNYDMTHYLSSKARQPIFVDPSESSELMKLSVKERDFIAPKSEPIINKDIDGRDKTVETRYHDPPPHTPYYVGDTWQRKVLDAA